MPKTALAKSAPAWDYGGAWRNYDMDGEIRLPNDSVVQVCDLTKAMPDYMRQADTLFIDPPWNTGNIRSFYTKADLPHEPFDFAEFSEHLWQRILEINPVTLFLEMGKQNVDKHADWCRKHFASVTIYRSTYYHKAANPTFVIHATNDESITRYDHLDGMDEEDIIAWVCANHPYRCIGDLCMGRGLVGRHAYLAGRRFVGTELNRKRLGVLVDYIAQREAVE